MTTATTRPTSTAPHNNTWVTACPTSSLTPERGVAVLLPNGDQVALFRTHDNALYAIDNIDPFTHAAVLARGIVGDRAGEPTVASPMLKHVFALRTGTCLDNPDVRQRTHRVREHNGQIHVRTQPNEAPA
ncbi:nitrite reductase (NADH) small subunit [Lipingzhangella halophila]|uniref:Nitrite reductase (NADH) small subunit n=1 Tax=Lipingzhangella halophila TaxID=1783352 RepID=A0A7W7W3M2_9ACTN|nr:nitrite reductase small subunit NirD [Lipingzhangella halophila]MBB4931949.1 nitrite reductase (NADH) small subunit [Lipingzhangella halophila]